MKALTLFLILAIWPGSAPAAEFPHWAGFAPSTPRKEACPRGFTRVRDKKGSHCITCDEGKLVKRGGLYVCEITYRDEEPKACSRSQECWLGEHCLNGSCIATGPGGGSCDIDNQCGLGKCVNRVCVTD